MVSCAVSVENTDAPTPPVSRTVDWPHAPPHRLGTSGSYFITASTLHRERRFHDATRLDLLHDALLAHAKEFGWQLEAWAVFSNHYHFIARPSKEEQVSADLGMMCKALHEWTARKLNALDQTPGRSVWHNYWDTHLTFENSYRARLNYVMQNPVKHGLVKMAKHYPWCSAAWFERVNASSWVQTIYRFRTDKLQIEDDFEV